MFCIRGRLAPSPSGRMHLGNAFSALLSWLSVRSSNGELVLRIEDLDVQRCKAEYSEQLIDDLKWLGIDWDISGKDYFQSQRSDIYEEYLSRLISSHDAYPCFCSRSQRLAASAPHADEYSAATPCPCLALSREKIIQKYNFSSPSIRLKVPNRTFEFDDGVFGKTCLNPANCCGDVILRRSDGMFAYQLAVVVDDALMGINQVIRGRDLLESTPVQIHLNNLLGFTPPEYSHIPLLLAPDGKRLSKREKSLDFGSLRSMFAPEELLGLLAHLAGIIDSPKNISLEELLCEFTLSKIARQDIYLPEKFCNRID